MRKSDLDKLLAELNQMRMMQFWIASGAFTVFTAGLAWITNRGLNPTDKAQSGFAFIGGDWIYLGNRSPKALESFDPNPFALAFVLIIVFGLLFYWLIGIRSMISMLSQYIICRKSSEWEEDYRAYGASHRYSSQTSSYKKIFMILGSITGAFPIFLMRLSGQMSESAPLTWLSAVCVFGIVIVTLVFNVWIYVVGRGGLLTAEENRYREQWTALLNAAGRDRSNDLGSPPG